MTKKGLKSYWLSIWLFTFVVSAMPSKYKTINGKKCEADLLDLAEKLTQTGALQLDGARKIWENALDGNRVTDSERNSIEHIMKNARHGLTDEANAFFSFWMKEKKATKMTGSALELVDGVKCDSPMIQVTKHFYKKSNPLSLRAAEGVWFCALDGTGVTKREKDTLEVIFRKYEFETSAREFLQRKLDWLSIAHGAAEAAAGGDAAAKIGPNAILLRFSDAVALADAPLPANSIRSNPSPSSSSISSASPPMAALVRGSQVRLHGLQTASLNDAEGTCDEWDDEKSRWTVRLKDGDVKSLKVENLQVMPTMGSKVRLQGLRSAPELNDTQGTVEEIGGGKNAWLVRILGGEVKTFKTENIQVLEVLRSKVELHSLQGAPELNGQLGTAEEWDADNRRWVVRLQSGEMKRVKSDNLKVLDEQAILSRKRKRSDEQGISLQRLRDIFDRCDINKDGLINKRELIKSCREDTEIAKFFHLPTTIRQEDGSRTKVEELFQDIDKDADREIRWAELLAYYRHLVVDI